MEVSNWLVYNLFTGRKQPTYISWALWVIIYLLGTINIPVVLFQDHEKKVETTTIILSPLEMICLDKKQINTTHAKVV